MNILGIITARGGSRGIRGKNIKLLGGKPLIEWTIAVARRSKLISHLIVSTDSPEIAGIAQSCGASVPFMRPAELATDSATSASVAKHATEFMEKKLGVRFDILVILQPTSPFRTVEDLDGTIRKLIRTKADSAVSVVEIPGNQHPIKAKKLNGSYLSPYCNCVVEQEGTPRQNFPKAYKRSGAVYAIRRDFLMKHEKLYGKTVVGYVVPPERSIDIDNEFDWAWAEYKIKKRPFDL